MNSRPLKESESKPEIYKESDIKKLDRKSLLRKEFIHFHEGRTNKIMSDKLDKVHERWEAIDTLRGHVGMKKPPFEEWAIDKRVILAHPDGTNIMAQYLSMVFESVAERPVYQINGFDITVKLKDGWMVIVGASPTR